MKKQGFTLIELMVVIVIMGILAAVAVPKLFGMIAKSKASEVGPAAGTYVKLQQAYFSESLKAGGWQLIGYLAPNNGATTNFVYGIGSLATNASTDNPNGVVGWQAANKANLNDCPAVSVTDANANGNNTGSHWTVTMAYTTGSNDIGFNATAQASSGTACVALTPTFDKIGK